jgi:hypothetical protein
MKYQLLSLLLVLASALTLPAHAQSGDAILRCDPGTLIKDIDGGWKSYYAAGHGAGFKECAIPLTPGRHQIQVCYSVSLGGATMVGGSMIANEATCGRSRDFTLDSQAGRTYRVRMNFSADWQASIDDVTELEAGLTYDDPPPKPKRSGSRKDEETLLILRATPDYTMLGLQKGLIRGKWFTVGQFGALKLFGVSRKGVPDGYHVFRAHAGDTFAFTSGQLMTGSILEIKSIVPCGDFPVRVYEDIPAGKVLYLGHLTFERAPGGYAAAYSDDLDEARAYIDSHRPDLAGRLEAAPFREARTANICRGTGYDLARESETPGKN